MKDERLIKIKDLINRIFLVLGKKKNDDIALVYAEEINKLNVKIIPSKLSTYIQDNYKKSYDYPSLDLFLKGLNIKSEQSQALNAWDSIQEILPYMKETTSYKSRDKILISTLAKIGINFIMQQQEAIDMYTNRINPFQLNNLKERFIRTYNEFQNGKELLELKEKKGVVNFLTTDYEIEEIKLLGQQTNAQIDEFKNNVDFIAKKIIGS